MSESADDLVARCAIHAPVLTSGQFAVGTVFGDWRLTAFIGRGGNGEVYCAEHVRLGTPAAVKALVRTEERARARFVREARLLSQLKSPAFPRFLSYGEASGVPYLAMELLEPDDLPTGDRAVARFLLAVCAGVTELHACGFVHRDIKPANILWRRNGGWANGGASAEPVLTDLGLVKRLTKQAGLPDESLTREVGRSTGVGTPVYGAPEQMERGEATAASDIHALGVLADQCFGNRPTFVWRRIIRRATSSIPRLRYPSVASFARAIRRRHLGRNALFGAGVAALTCIGLSIGIKSLVESLAPHEHEKAQIVQNLERGIFTLQKGKLTLGDALLSNVGQAKRHDEPELPLPHPPDEISAYATEWMRQSLDTNLTELQRAKLWKETYAGKRIRMRGVVEDVDRAVEIGTEKSKRDYEVLLNGAAEIADWRAILKTLPPPSEYAGRAKVALYFHVVVPAAEKNALAKLNKGDEVVFEAEPSWIQKRTVSQDKEGGLQGYQPWDPVYEATLKNGRIVSCVARSEIGSARESLQLPKDGQCGSRSTADMKLRDEFVGRATQFVNDCLGQGLTELQREQRWDENYEGKRIRLRGVVVSVRSYNTVKRPLEHEYEVMLDGAADIADWEALLGALKIKPRDQRSLRQSYGGVAEEIPTEPALYYRVRIPDSFKDELAGLNKGDMVVFEATPQKVTKQRWYTMEAGPTYERSICDPVFEALMLDGRIVK